MPSYALWNNKGGVGKSYLTFQIACQYAITHPDKNVLVLDLCPQANSSIMLLGGMDGGEKHLDEIASRPKADHIRLYRRPPSQSLCQPQNWGDLPNSAICDQ